MEPNIPALSFDAPIPGQSLTNSPGSFPFETPPQFADTREAAEYLFDMVSTKASELKMVILQGAPVEAIARGLLMKGFTIGKWTPDAAFILMPILMMQIVSVMRRMGLDEEDITIFNPRPDKEMSLAKAFAMIPEDKKNKYFGAKKPEMKEEPEQEDIKGILGAFK